MSNTKLYLRFGVHKDRQVMHENRDLFAGLVVPAHIFVHSTNATIAAISYVHKPFFIDPMTHILAVPGIEDYVTLSKKNSSRVFKPSIAKLVEAYGLSAFFSDGDYKPLKTTDFTDIFVESLVRSSLQLQQNKVDEGKGGAVQKYLQMLQNVGEDHVTDFLAKEQKPVFVTTPYFHFNSLSSEWLDINLRIAHKTKELHTSTDVVPVVLTDASCLGTGLLDKYNDFSRLVIWITDFNEKMPTNGDNSKFVAKLKKMKDFVAAAKDRNIEIYNLYGGYFSAVLTKIGLSGFSHGIFYGEYKSKNTSVGGVPPSRYYIRKLHEFFTIPETLSLLAIAKYRDLLDIDCQEAMELIGSDASNIFAFDKDQSLAQKHFLITRERELELIDSSTISEIVADLNSTYEKYSPLPEVVTRKRIDFLQAWSEALE